MWKNKVYKVIIVFIIISSIYIYKNYNNGNDIIIYIGNEKIILDSKKEDQIIDLQSFTSETDTIIKVKSQGNTIKINGEKIKRKKNLGKINIKRDAILELEVEYSNEKAKKYIINLLPSNFPEYTVKGKSEYEGDYYTSTYTFDYDSDNHYIFKMDVEGNIIFYKKTNMVAFDFQKQKNSKGDVRYLYLEATDNTYEGKNSILPCDLVILDENYIEIDRITHIISEDKKIKLDNHNYIYIDDNHYILVGYERITAKKGNKNLYVYNCIIQEVKNGKKIWEFNTKDYDELYEYSTAEYLDYTKKYQDYAHFNSMYIDKSDANLLVSFRNLDAILKIDRKSGKLIWILGGKGDQFNLKQEEKSSKQHSVIYTKAKKILLYDNGNNNKRSRIIEYTLDEEAKKIEKFKEYDLGLYAYMMGSVRVVDEKNKVYLLCYGGMDYNKSSIQEINLKTGEVYFEFTFNDTKSIYNVNKYK